MSPASRIVLSILSCFNHLELFFFTKFRHLYYKYWIRTMPAKIYRLNATAHTKVRVHLFVDCGLNPKEMMVLVHHE